MGIDRYTHTSFWSEVNVTKKATLWLLGMGIAFSGIIKLQIIYSILIIWLTFHNVSISLKSYSKLLSVPLFFLLLSIMTINFAVRKQGNDLILSLPVGSYFIGWIKGGGDTLVHLVGRVITSMIVTYYFALTTPFKQLLKLMKKLRIPSVVIELCLLMYRFIFVLFDEMSNIYQAQQIRQGYVSPITMLHSSAQLGQMLFIRLLENANQMNETLTIKMYDGEFYIEKGE